jgi:hypothetical protein
MSFWHVTPKSVNSHVTSLLEPHEAESHFTTWQYAQLVKFSTIFQTLRFIAVFKKSRYQHYPEPH